MRALLLTTGIAALSLQAQPRVQTFTLPNGLQVLLLEDHEHPLVRVRLHLKMEATGTPAGHQGLPLLVMQMFAHSDVADLKVEEFNRLQEESGIQLSHTLKPDGLEWQLVARSRDQDRALGLLANRLLRTVFDPSMLEIQRLACWRQENRQADDPHTRLLQALAQNPDSKPTLTTLGAISWEDLLTFRAKVFRPDRAVLVLHGDLGLEQAKRLVLLSLGSWTVQAPPKPTDPPSARPSNQPLAAPAGPPRIIAPGAGIRIQAFAVQPSQLTPETRLLLRLLIDGNATLHPVRMAAHQGGLVATLDAEADASGSGAWSLLHERLEALCRRGFTSTDLEHARAVWQASRSLDSLHPEAQVDAALAEAMGRAVTVEGMKAVSLEKLNEGLRSWLAPANLRSGAAGEPAWLKTLPKP